MPASRFTLTVSPEAFAEIRKIIEQHNYAQGTQGQRFSKDAAGKDVIDLDGVSLIARGRNLSLTLTEQVGVKPK